MSKCDTCEYNGLGANEYPCDYCIYNHTVCMTDRYEKKDDDYDN